MSGKMRTRRPGFGRPHADLRRTDDDRRPRVRRGEQGQDHDPRDAASRGEPADRATQGSLFASTGAPKRPSVAVVNGEAIELPAIEGRGLAGTASFAHALSGLHRELMGATRMPLPSAAELHRHMQMATTRSVVGAAQPVDPPEEPDRRPAASNERPDATKRRHRPRQPRGEADPMPVDDDRTLAIAFGFPDAQLEDLLGRIPKDSSLGPKGSMQRWLNVQRVFLRFARDTKFEYMDLPHRHSATIRSFHGWVARVLGNLGVGREARDDLFQGLMEWLDDQVGPGESPPWKVIDGFATTLRAEAERRLQALPAARITSSDFAQAFGLDERNRKLLAGLEADLFEELGLKPGSDEWLANLTATAMDVFVDQPTTPAFLKRGDATIRDFELGKHAVTSTIAAKHRWVRPRYDADGGMREGAYRPMFIALYAALDEQLSKRVVGQGTRNRAEQGLAALHDQDFIGQLERAAEEIEKARTAGDSPAQPREG